jgi:cytochrome c-type biogenesis protein CcsB
MQKKIAAFLFSTRLTAFLFILFAVAMAVGTFLDQGYPKPPSPYARELIFNAWWFEAIMVFFVINFLGNIARFKLYKKEKWATLTLHLAFILIILGAFITRYIGFEGVMHIREGATEQTFLSDQTYITTYIDGDYKVDGVLMRRNVPSQLVRLSERLTPDASWTTDYNGQQVSFKVVDFISNAKDGLVEDPEGELYLKLVESGDGSRHEHYLKEGSVTNIHNLLYSFNQPTPGAINIEFVEGQYFIESPFAGDYLRMVDQQKGTVEAEIKSILELRSLYQVGGTAFVIPEPALRGKMDVVKASEQESTGTEAAFLEVTTGKETQRIALLGGKGLSPAPKVIEIGGLIIGMSYGSKSYELPFSITLNDFIAEKYPGTEKAYSSFKSKVTVNNQEGFFDYDIYMNHILDHGGYRFFQASFDPDEKGTVLSVNHDWWGTYTTYLGYFLLYIGLMAILFDRHTRFKELEKMLDKVKRKKKTLLLLPLVFMFSGLSAQTMPMNSQKADSIVLANAVNKEQAEAFGRLILQDNGRMKPVNTFSSELLRKISGKDDYKGLNPDQVFLSMTEFPMMWYGIPILKLDWRNDSIKKILGVQSDTKQIALIDLFDERGNSKIDRYVEAASAKTNPNQFEKDFIKLYEKSYVLNEALGGGILKIFPIPGSVENKWIAYQELSATPLKSEDSLFIRNIMPIYFQGLREYRQTGDESIANQALEAIARYQQTFGAAVYPNTSKVSAEIAYNRIDPFNKLYRYFGMFGVLMLLVIMIQIFSPRPFWQYAIRFFKGLIWILFIGMTLALAARWYISGHAPWSDAYESVIYVSWATVFFGLAFGRKSDLTIASTAFVASILLWVAHLSWLDPQIANLQPVLDSYWLMIHVAVIVASYGPFTLGLILGAVALLLMCLSTTNNRQKIMLNINELTIINEMALTVGLVMLTIGNFLGGQWANESWGRYWGWDPKETWALISIMIYAFVIHSRLVPGLRGKWTFNILAIFAYASIMMTYFGVNFYLTGLHSYASGDVPVTPSFIYYLLGFFVLLSAVSYWRWQAVKKA